MFARDGLETGVCKPSFPDGFSWVPLLPRKPTSVSLAYICEHFENSMLWHIREEIGVSKSLGLSYVFEVIHIIYSSVFEKFCLQWVCPLLLLRKLLGESCVDHREGLLGGIFWALWIKLCRALKADA